MTIMTKTYDFAALLQNVKRCRLESREVKIVHCHGVFDAIHIGHVRYLEEARRLGDILIVTLTQDQYLNKGFHRPAFIETLRAEAIAALACVDYVAISQGSSVVETIQALEPEIHVVGEEFRNQPSEAILKEKAAVEKTGGKLCYVDGMTSDVSQLNKQHWDVFSPQTREYLSLFSDRFSIEEIQNYFELCKPLRVLVVGDAIIDQYEYCEVIGKASKEPTLVGKFSSLDVFSGGALAIGNHVANFSDNVHLLSILGEQDSFEDFIRQHMSTDIHKTFLYKKGAPTTLKKRFVEAYLQTKLFETYVIDDRELSDKENDQLCSQLEFFLPQCDVVIVADFGHGMISKEAIDVLCNNAKFLAVNTQVNAGNRGFNTILKYHRADYVCLNESEFRLELRDRYGKLQDMIKEVSDRLGGAKVMSTKGKYGLIGFDPNEGFCEVPSLATQIVDRIGAGDAVFALTSLFVSLGIPMEMVGFLGNIVGADAVSIVGNQRAVDRDALFRLIASVMR